jgi:hypothetical protein
MLYLFGDFNDWLQHNPKFLPPRLGSSPSPGPLATPRQAKSLARLSMARLLLVHFAIKIIAIRACFIRARGLFDL